MRDMRTSNPEFLRDDERPRNTGNMEAGGGEPEASAHSLQQPEGQQAELHARGLPERFGTDAETSEEAYVYAYKLYCGYGYLLNWETALAIAKDAERFWRKDAY